MRTMLLVVSALMVCVCGPAETLVLAGGKQVTATNPAVQANNDFACALYQQLGQTQAGKNVFFSPYSISSALAMTLEGARGKTADEMGLVLHLPDSLRAPKEAAETRPWKMAPFHLGFNELNRRLSDRPDALKGDAIRQKVTDLRKQLEQVNGQVRTLEKQGKFNEVFKLQGQSQKLADAINTLSKQVDQYEVRVANAVWAEKNFPFDTDYFDAISKYYGSDTLRNADFIGNFKGERTKINNWVLQQTNDRIKDLIPDYPPEFARLIRMILVNAIYFKGQWATPFEAKFTKNEPFLLADGSKTTAPLMQVQNLRPASYAAFNADGSWFDTPAQIPSFGGEKVNKYPEGNGFLMAELPIKGEKLSMVVIVPQKAEGLAALENKLTGSNLSAWLGKLKKRPVNVALPRFKMETDYSLADALKAMGMKLAFTERIADFTGMSTSRNPDDRLYIAAVLHKAFVEVNEQGAEAAAATAVIMAVPTSLPVTMPFTPSLRADRPFLFLFRDMDSGAILFLGRITQPPAK